jgi:DNA-binding MarR family transcriptional regulator
LKQVCLPHISHALCARYGKIADLDEQHRGTPNSQQERWELGVPNFVAIPAQKLPLTFHRFNQTALLENYIVIRYNYGMERNPKAAAQRRLQTLAEFRYTLRQFLNFSEGAATRAGLHPQHHQLLLQISGAPDGVVATVSYAAEKLGLRHNSVVELSKRCEEEGLIHRTHNMRDQRCVVLQVTAKGDQLLQSLSEDHARELYELGPQLIEALTRIRNSNRRRVIPEAANEV